MKLRVRLQPGARADQVLGFHAGALRLRVTAPPEKGRANEAAVALLARTLGISKSRVLLLSGAVSRDKLFEVQGLEEAQVRQRLSVPLDKA